MKSKLPILIAMFLFVMCCSAALQAQEEQEQPLLPPDTTILADMYTRINAYRERRGLTPYRLNDALNHAAQEQAEFLVRNHYRSHFRPDGSRPSTRAAAYGFVTSHWCCGENYYMSIDATPDMVFDFWRWSPSHWVNLAHRDFTDIGLGMSSDGYRISYVTLFGEADDLHPPEPAEALTVASEQPAPAAAEAPAENANAAVAAPTSEYVVVVGDTLGIIAARHNTTVQALMAANRLANPEIIYVGQRLLLPGAAPVEAAAEPAAEANSEVAAVAPVTTQQHIVVVGDTMALIAARYGTTIQAITAANNISDPSIIYVGQVLNIPPAQ